MAEQSVSGSGQSVQRAVENTFYQALGRYWLPLACSVAMFFAGLVGARVLNQQDEMARVLASMQTDVAVMKNDIGYLKEKVKP